MALDINLIHMALGMHMALGIHCIQMAHVHTMAVITGQLLEGMWQLKLGVAWYIGTRC